MNTGVGELPPGAAMSDSDENDKIDADDPHHALNIDLDEPLREEENLKVSIHTESDLSYHGRSGKTANKSKKVSKNIRV